MKQLKNSLGVVIASAMLGIVCLFQLLNFKWFLNKIRKGFYKNLLNITMYKLMMLLRKVEG